MNKLYSATAMGLTWAVLALLLPLHQAAAARHLAASASRTRFLYVWAGAANASLGGKDALFVLKADTTDDGVGTLIRTVQTPYNGLEPHHCKVSADGKYLGASGLLAVLSGLPSLHVFNLSNPAKPKYISGTTQPSRSAIGDEFLPLPQGGFLVSMMGSAAGATPGHILKYSPSMRLVGEYPTTKHEAADTAGYPGLNPHGIAADFRGGVLASTDFVEPASILPGNTMALRTTVRLWDLDTLRTKAVLDIKQIEPDAAGAMDVTAIGSTGQFYATAGNRRLYLIDKPNFAPNCTLGNCAAPAVTEAWDFAPGRRGFSVCLLKSFRGGTRLLATVQALDKVVLLDTTNTAHPVKLDEYILPTGTGAHMVVVNREERLVAVATYFLQAGQVQAPSDYTVRLFKLNKAATKLKPHPTTPIVDFKTVAGSKGVYKPHGLAFF